VVLGITGNIASGKSSVAAEFKRLGAAVVDADQLAREAVEPGSDGLARLVALFGEEILTSDGALNRSCLAGIIFTDPDARKQLNAIIHPAIAKLALSRLTELRNRTATSLIIYEAPLLFEAGAESRVDKVLVVKIDAEIQRQRLMKRDNLSVEDADIRIATQMDQDEKLQRADYVIDNSGSLERMKEQVESLWKNITS
jgi:dephospho-CoA kinase